MPKGIKKVLDSIVDWALHSFWTWLGSVLLASLTVWLAHTKGVRGPWIDRGIGFIGGLSVVVLLSGSVASAKAIRARAEVRRNAAPAIAGKKGWLDFRGEWQKAQKELLVKLGEITAETQAIERIYSVGAKRLAAAARRSTPENLVPRLRKASSATASRLDKGAARLGLCGQSFKAISARLTENQLADLRYTARTLPPDRRPEELAGVLAAITQFRDSIVGALAGNERWRQIVAGAEQPTQELDAASKHLLAVLEGMNEVMQILDRHCEDMISAINDAGAVKA